jgi:hypothetical protein
VLLEPLVQLELLVLLVLQVKLVLLVLQVQLAQRVLTVLSQVQLDPQESLALLVQLVPQVPQVILVEQHLTTPLILLQLTATLALGKLDLTVQTFKSLPTCLLTMSLTAQLIFNSSLELLMTRLVR